jgi:hypothetical protein
MEAATVSIAGVTAFLMIGVGVGFILGYLFGTRDNAEEDAFRSTEGDDEYTSRRN